MRKKLFSDLLPFASPLLALVEQVRERGATINEYRVEIGGPKIGAEKVIDVHAAPLPKCSGAVILMLQERTIAEKIDRQLTYRGSARSVSALATMLAHEIKNPLAGIRGRGAAFRDERER